MLWDLNEIRKYRVLNPGHFLELKSYLESEKFLVKKKQELSSTGYLYAIKRGLNVNWKSHVEYKWDLLQDGSYRVSLRYYAVWKALTSIATGILTVGVSAAVGAATYSAAIREAEVFFENMWLRIEHHVASPEERVVLDKIGFGRYEPHFTEEEQRLMKAHEPTTMGQSLPGATAGGFGSGAAASNMVNPPGFVPASTVETAQPFASGGFGGETLAPTGMSDIKTIHKPGTIGETMLSPGTGNVIDPNLPTQY